MENYDLIFDKFEYIFHVLPMGKAFKYLWAFRWLSLRCNVQDFFARDPIRRVAVWNKFCLDLRELVRRYENYV